jgi:hypothetical protein
LSSVVMAQQKEKSRPTLAEDARMGHASRVFGIWCRGVRDLSG